MAAKMPATEYLNPQMLKARLASVSAEYFPDRTTASGVHIYQAQAGFFIGVKAIPAKGVYEVSYHAECPCVHS